MQIFCPWSYLSLPITNAKGASTDHVLPPAATAGTLLLPSAQMPPCPQKNKLCGCLGAKRFQHTLMGGCSWGRTRKPSFSAADSVQTAPRTQRRRWNEKCQRRSEFLLPETSPRRFSDLKVTVSFAPHTAHLALVAGRVNLYTLLTRINALR